jgi:tRNA-2-methylthio-N6-dimethylallyladenosine synthase
MRGCDNMCSFCVVPFTRGRERSRDPQSIVQEARDLFALGYREVTLLGQNVDSYKWAGEANKKETDRAEANGKPVVDFADLLQRVALVDPDLRVRFSTSHPKDITDELLATMAELPKVARHLHVPAQAGADRVLRVMGRRYTRDDYRRFVDRARTHMPEVELLSDFIVGFPTETTAEFDQTVTLMEEVRFAGSYVFMYSQRPGTPAVRLPDDVPEAEKNRRCNVLLNLQMKHQTAQHEALRAQRAKLGA